MSPLPESGKGADAATPWAHKGGACRIHAFDGALRDGTARQACRPKQLITSAWQTGIARTKEEAASLTRAQWCKACARLV